MPGTLGTIELTAGVLLVLEGLGARVRPVDLEEVGVASFQMAPDLFAMKRYPEYPRLDTVYYALKDLKKKGHVAGSLRAGWTLTSEGNIWLKKTKPGYQSWTNEDLKAIVYRMQEMPKLSYAE